MKKMLVMIGILVLLVACAKPMERPVVQQPPAEAPPVVPPAEIPPVAPPVAEEKMETAATTHNVEIKGFAFNPPVINIKKGDSITWTNQDGVGHTATGDGFDTGILMKGESKTIAFNEVGEFRYICTPHPNMRGKIIVE